jgi:hypothetical protein
MATRAELRLKLRRKMHDEDTNLFQDALLNDAINAAVDAAWPSWYIGQEDTSIAIASNTFRYALPGDCESLSQVWLQQATSDPYARIWEWRWARETSGTGTVTSYLYLDRSNNYETGKLLRLLYEARPQSLDNDTDSTSVPTEFIIAKATVYLGESMLFEAPGKDVEMWQRVMQWNQQIAEDIRNRRRMQHQPSHIHQDIAGGSVDIYSQPGLVGRVRPS